MVFTVNDYTRRSMYIVAQNWKNSEKQKNSEKHTKKEGENMEKAVKVVLAMFACATLMFGGVVAGYYALMPPQADSAVIPDAEEPQTPVVQAAAAAYVPPPVSAPAPSPAPVLVQSSTRIVYEYVYIHDGIVETTEEIAPYFLLNADEARLRTLFEDWEVVQFSAETVVLRRELESSGIQRYIVGVQDGYVSVFYSRPHSDSGDETRLKEITNTRVSALPEDEQRRLMEGVPVNGEDELLRILQDYGS